jgi:hypothetical protein
VDARADRPEGDVERRGDLLVAEVRPGVEQQRLAVALLDLLEGGRERGVRCELREVLLRARHAGPRLAVEACSHLVGAGAVPVGLLGEA